MELIRNCPKCGKLLTYKNVVSYNRQNKINGLCRSCSAFNSTNKQSNLEILLDTNSYESLYWIGFIMADGTILNNNRLKITLATKDANHLIKFQNYCNIEKITIDEIKCSVNAMDKEIVPKIAELFDLKKQKTYNPPSLDMFKKLTKEQILSIIIGFIDGDGNIKNQYKRKDWSITIKNHKTWLPILSYFSEVINGKNIAIINNKGYAKVTFSNTEQTKSLKKFAIKHKLPLLERKWNIIDLNYKGQYEIRNEKYKLINNLVQEGKKVKEINAITNISIENIYQIIRECNINYNYERKK